MTCLIDETHEFERRSWISSANVAGSDFPIQNLPFGIYEHRGERRAGIAIGDRILDIAIAINAGLISGEAADAAGLAVGSSLNRFMQAGHPAANIVRRAVSDTLDARNKAAERKAEAVPDLLVEQAAITMALPCQIGDYTDFLTSLHHVERNGMLKGLDVPLPPACHHIPVAYHGRASSIVPSGTAITRPKGQWKSADGTVGFGPAGALDFELELGVFIGSENALGQPVPLCRVRDNVFGYCLLNDWSAKDVQWLEQVLGPFLGKNFASTISPWIVTEEALAPFRMARAVHDLDDAQSYLIDAWDQSNGGLALLLSASLSTAAMRDRGVPPVVITRTSLDAMHWSVGQMVAHHTVNGCNLRAGDLLGSGTLSGAGMHQRACLTEIAEAGRKPLDLPGDEQRGWLQDGDEIVLHARAEREGFVGIGFGDCRGTILAANP